MKTEKKKEHTRLLVTHPEVEVAVVVIAAENISVGVRVAHTQTRRGREREARVTAFHREVEGGDGTLEGRGGGGSLFRTGSFSKTV